MAAEIGLLDSTHLQNITQSQQQQQQPQVVQFNPSPNSSSSWMWNNNINKQASRDDDEDDSWEVKAFEEDTANIFGATWPPRSYACTFCRREFRSAQALGGHMNVHRRDRARLHQTPIGSNKPLSSSNASPFLIPPRDFVTSGGLCFLYSLPTPNGLLPPTIVNTPLATNNLLSQSMNFQITPDNIYHSPDPEPQTYSINSSFYHNNNSEHATSQASHHENCHQDHKEHSATEEIDLELRLGRRSP